MRNQAGNWAEEEGGRMRLRAWEEVRETGEAELIDAGGARWRRRARSAAGAVPTW
jgi:hypothetical protein